MLLTGWVIAGAIGAVVGVIATVVIRKFWEEIAEWLNNVAADFVEKHLGYNARQRMQRAVSTVNRVVNKIRNVSVVYTKKDRLDNCFDKTTIIAEEDIYEVKQEVLEEARRRGSMVQEFNYMQ